MTRLDPQNSSCCISVYFHEHRQTLCRITEGLAKDAARFDAACKLQRIAIMAGGLQAAALANLRFWSALQDMLAVLDTDTSDIFSYKMNVLADFAAQQSRLLLSMTGDIHAVLSINQALLAAGGKTPATATDHRHH